METKKVLYSDIKEANKLVKTTEIRPGKSYAEVPQRVKAFRFLYPEGSIETEILSIENGVVIMKATAKDENGRVLATGTAYEKENASQVNRTSYIENCETSAVGRCLAFLSLGSDVSIASYEEVKQAIAQQNAPAPAQATKQQTTPNKADGLANIKAKIDAAKTVDELKTLRDQVNATNRYVEEMQNGGELNALFFDKTVAINNAAK